jgi:outer membrane receptor protein involved in Fe transport
MNRWVSALILFLFAVLVQARGQLIALTELISQLQQRGHVILYSSGLVNSAQQVRVENVDMQALEQALVEFGLQLQARDGLWVVARAEQTPPLEPGMPEPAEEKQLLETVIVTGSMRHIAAVGPVSSGHSFSAVEMRMEPSLASDAMRVALRLPGVSSVGISAKPRIRGGLADELLVMQDGVELLEPFHLADYHSAYSSIDYYTIESLDIYTGGFPARYGNRMSGVMDIRNQWQDEDYNTNIGLSSFADFINTRGEFGQEHPTQWLLSYRQGDLAKLTDYIETKSGEPKYKDGSARMNIALSEKIDLAFGATYAEDDIVFNGESERTSSNIDTYYLWGALGWEVSANVHNRLTLSWLDFERKKEQRSFEDEAKGGFMDYRQQVQRLALRNDWHILKDGTVLEFGWQAEYGQAEYDNTSLIDRGELADILGNERLVVRGIALQPDGLSGGTYVQAEWELAPRLTIQPSLRWDFQDYYLQRDTQYQLAPRLGLAYDLNEDTLARLSLGRFYQPESIQELQVVDGITRFFAPQHSDQVVAGLEWRRGELELVGDIYYKRYGAQKERFENIFNPFVLLPEMEPDRVSLYPSKALARGFDLDGSFSISDSLSGHVRYSYMDARDRINGNWVDRRWSQDQTVNADMVWQQDSLSLSLAVTWHAGWRTSVLPPYVADGTVIPVESVLNNTQLRDYFSIDIGARKSWEIGRTRVQVYADISNVTDRHNQAGIDFDVEEVDGGYDIFPDQETLLGRVSSVGITLSF